MSDESYFEPLKQFLRGIPGIDQAIGCGTSENGCWWVKLIINVEHKLAWNVVQELGHVLNYLSLDERLPTIFMPVSPPPYMNGGPKKFLSWVIESKQPDFTPANCAEWLEGRLPRQVEDLTQWEVDDSDADSC